MEQQDCQDSTVWPPPPLGSASLAAWFPFRTVDLRLEGQGSGLRGGWIGVDSAGLMIHGKKAVEFPGWLFGGLFYLVHAWLPHWLPTRLSATLLAVLLASVLLLFVFRTLASVTVPWSQVRQVVYDQEKRRAGIVYTAPDHKGIIRTYSLVFTLKAAL